MLNTNTNDNNNNNNSANENQSVRCTVCFSNQKSFQPTKFQDSFIISLSRTNKLVITIFYMKTLPRKEEIETNLRLKLSNLP